MTLKQNWVSRAVRTLKLGASGVALLATAGGLTSGCLDRPVAPAQPRTSNVVTKAVPQSGVDKIDLLFMIDNSISMADKQAILAEAVPVLVSRLIDPVCVDGEGMQTGGTQGQPGGCQGGSSAEFPPIRNIHIGVITSSLGNHGGDVCVPDPMDMTARTLNDQAQLVASMRPAANPPIYSWNNNQSGFLVWDPRMGADRPNPDPHQPLSNHETDAATFVADFQTHVRAAGERGCGYEASLEAWYRFLVDPEPIATVTNDGTFSVRGQVNNVVLTQRAAFMRPDSLLAIVMLTDENDCSIIDENGYQGWLVGRRINMPRASSECANPGSDSFNSCCRPCVVEREGCPASASDPECAKGATLTPIEDSTNLRCFKQSQRFGFSLLYSTQRYVDGLKLPRLGLRAPDMAGNTDVPNPLFKPGVDGTPARESSLVFLAGIIGVPWQDIADDASRMAGNRGLRYLTAPELGALNRWDVILGDPDNSRQPSDPFMVEQIDPRSGANPITGDMMQPPVAGTAGNAINGHEQNVVGRDDLQYACTFDLVPDVLCNMTNQDGCDCNASEAANLRSLCQYGAANTDGTQVNAKAYPGVRHLQVLKGFGENAIVASICPKNVQAMGANDAAYGYNPAVAAIIDRLKKALVATCLPRPLVAGSDETVPCKATEAFLPPMGQTCAQVDACNKPGRSELNPETAKAVRSSVEEELAAGLKCGQGTGVSCSSYCMCELTQFTGTELQTCQTAPTDPMSIYGYCYVEDDSDPNTPQNPLLRTCPETQQQIIRFMGSDMPRKGSTAYISCLGASTSETDGGM